MAVAEGKTRVMITMSNALLGRLDEYCERTGLSRSAYISTSVARQLDSEERVMSSMEEVIAQLLGQAAKASDLKGGTPKLNTL